MKKGLRKWSVFLVFCGGALLCGIVTLFSGLIRANVVGGLTPATALELTGGQPGTEVLIEGQINRETPVQHRDYVAYIREKREVEDEEGDRDLGNWRVRERVTPPLLIETVGIVVRIPNDDYDLDVATATEERPARSGTPATTRYRGLTTDEPVIVLGTLVSGGDRPHVEAELIADGTQASHVSRQRIGGTIFCIGSVVVAGLGALVLGWERITP